MKEAGRTRQRRNTVVLAEMGELAVAAATNHAVRSAIHAAMTAATASPAERATHRNMLELMNCANFCKCHTFL